MFNFLIKQKKYIYQIDNTLYNDAPNPKQATEIILS